MDNTPLTGRHIYKDKKDRYYYYDTFTKQAFHIYPQDEKQYTLYSNRFLLVILAMILCAGYFLTWLQAIALGIGLCIVAEGLFRFRYLYKLQKCKLPESAVHKSLLDTLLEKKQPNRAVIKALLYLAFAILILINAYVTKAALALVFISALLSVAACYYAFINLMAFIKIKTAQ